MLAWFTTWGRSFSWYRCNRNSSTILADISPWKSWLFISFLFLFTVCLNPIGTFCILNCRQWLCCFCLIVCSVVCHGYQFLLSLPPVFISKEHLVQLPTNKSVLIVLHHWHLSFSLLWGIWEIIDFKILNWWYFTLWKMLQLTQPKRWLYWLPSSFYNSA